MLEILVLIILTAIVLEFGIHIIVFAKTGRGGLNEPAFDIYKRYKGRHLK